MVSVLQQILPGESFVFCFLFSRWCGVDKMAQQAAGVIIETVDEQQFARSQQGAVALDIVLYGLYVCVVEEW